MFLIFLLSSLTIAQVKIKEEIILAIPNNISSNVITTPFYADVFIHFDAPGQKMRAILTVGDRVKLLNEVTGQTYDCSCGFPLWHLLAEWTEQDIPALTPVSLEVLQCQQVDPDPPPNGTCDWVTMPVELTPHPEIQNRYDIAIDINFPNTPPIWESGGHIAFIEQVPPDCPNAEGNYCTGLLPDYPNVLIQQVEYSSQYRRYDDCIEAVVWAYTVPAEKNYVVDFNVSDVCFNQQTQTWQFRIDNNNFLFVRNILQICNKSQILEDFSQLPPGYSCEELMKDLDAMENREIYQYLFRDLL